MFCTNCGSQYDENRDSVCTNCGSAVQTAANNPVAQQAPPMQQPPPIPPPIPQQYQPQQPPQAPPMQQMQPPPAPPFQPPPMQQYPQPQQPPIMQHPQQFQPPGQNNMVNMNVGISPKNKTMMMILSIFGFHLGLQYFYAGLTKKAMIMLVLYWPCMVIGWIFFFVGGFFLVVVQALLVVMAVKDFLKLLKGELLDSNGLRIVD